MAMFLISVFDRDDRDYYTPDLTKEFDDINAAKSWCIDNSVDGVSYAVQYEINKNKDACFKMTMGSCFGYGD